MLELDNKKKNVCVITDNAFIFENFLEIIANYTCSFDFFFSEKNSVFKTKYKNSTKFKPIELNGMGRSFFEKYDVFFSLHCKQIFPDYMVNNYRCINVHPGYNPYNRGWFPQVFSIINKYPIGVTIHEIDNELDHGDIIVQELLEIEDYETSSDVYQRILDLELKLLRKHLPELIENTYNTKKMENEGNVNYRKDFNKLCQIDLEKIGTFREFIDLLRATSFSGYDNAFFKDEYGNKIYISINLKKESP